MADGGGWHVPERGPSDDGGALGLRATLAELRALAMDLAVRERLEVAQAADIIDLCDLIEARFSARGDLLQPLIEALVGRLRVLEPGPTVAGPPPLRRSEPLVRAILAVSTACAVLSVGGLGLITLQRAAAPGVHATVVLPVTAPAAAPVTSSADVEPIGPQAGPSASSERPARLAPRTAPPGDVSQVVAALSRGEPGALPRLVGLAQGGNAGAQLRLAALYETGGAGLTPDLIAARDWTRRAAESGDRLAMHNLALFLSRGEGGRRDLTAAAGWFRRAAERGVVDAQYNLARLYEDGRGVERNLREAYRWYGIAAQAGDLAARERAVDLEARLTPAERRGLDRAVAAFEPGQGAAPDDAPVIAPATTVAETQALLARRGYYVGPIDGVASPALASAARAFLSDQTPGRPPA